MAGLEDTRELARLERAVRTNEAEAARLAAMRPPETVHEDPELLAAVDALAAARPDLSYAHELKGRLRVALSFPLLHRDTPVRLPDGRQASAEARSHYYGAFDAFFRASYLDPSEPEPRVGYMEVWNAKYALHWPWRWIGGYSIDQALRAARLSPRPDAMLRIVRHLTLLDRPVTAAGLLEPWRRTTDLEPDVRAALELARMRALLAGGGRVPPDEVAALEVPPALAPDQQLLLGWAQLVAGDVRAGFEAVMGTLQEAPGPRYLQKDLPAALCDPRGDARQLAQLLMQAVPPPGNADQSPVVHWLLLARALARARLGDPGHGEDLARLQQIDPGAHMPTREGARFSLAAATGAARSNPQHPNGHLQALLLWANVNIDVGSTEAEVEAARDVIVERLRRLGAAPLAEQWAELDPVDEVYVRRAWVPPDVHAWRLPEEGR
jgi:hypothetical protein